MIQHSLLLLDQLTGDTPRFLLFDLLVQKKKAGQSPGTPFQLENLILAAWQSLSFDDSPMALRHRFYLYQCLNNIPQKGILL
jgi:hypothetical protein